MIVLDCDQGTPEWIDARLGIPTASQFSRIVTSTGKASSQAHEYIGELLAEWALGRPYVKFAGNEWTERGNLLEPDARDWYEFATDSDVRQVGLIYKDESRTAAASPDALVGDDGLLELKCPGAGKHLFYLSNDVCPREYRMQVQGQLWVTGRAWCDFVSFYPRLPGFRYRVAPDPKIQAALDAIMDDFQASLIERRLTLLELGVTPAVIPEPKPEAEAEAAPESLFITDEDVQAALDNYDRKAKE